MKEAKPKTHDDFVHMWAQWDRPDKCREMYMGTLSSNTKGGLFYILRLDSWKPVATHIWVGKRHAVLLLSQTHIPSQSFGNQHPASRTRWATSQYTQIYVPMVVNCPLDLSNKPRQEWINDLCDIWVAELEEGKGKAERATSDTYKISMVNGIRKEINSFTEFFRVKGRLSNKLKKLMLLTDARWSSEQHDRLDRLIKAREEREGDPVLRAKAEGRRDKARQRKARELQEAGQTALADWRLGADHGWNTTLTPYWAWQNALSGNRERGYLWNIRRNDLLRVVDNQVNTSQGVTLPMRFCHKLFGLVMEWLGTDPELQDDKTMAIRLCVSKYTSFTLRNLTETHLRIGCHNIPISEIRYIGRLMGWIPVEHQVSVDGIPYKNEEVTI